MDAIRKKMQSLKNETDHLLANIDKYEATKVAADREADKHDCDIRDLGKKITNNKIKTNGAMMVTELLFTHDKLLSLNLGNNKIDHDGVIGILSVLNSSNYNLEELNIDNPVYRTICQSVAIHFGKMF